MIYRIKLKLKKKTFRALLIVILASFLYQITDNLWNLLLAIWFGMITLTESFRIEEIDDEISKDIKEEIKNQAEL